ncbi:MAG TPA: thiamine pyrophosphate-dependent enzyme, partial [Candidatus Ozemobacteraceae bacterium]|nr:thiamine pyrophosphate-dependent enzyme [Candidatus Ozemobacteraceae bacterium]
MPRRARADHSTGMPRPAPLATDILAAVPDSLLIMTGAAAAARGAYEAGIGLAVTYPGSPITETFEVLAAAPAASAPVCHLVINEHVAFHKAMGYALSGGRALVTMKHVGFNVAADPAHYIGYTGVRGGMVILVGTDPGATCSTGEYDFRFYAPHTHLPLLEPRSGQEILDALRQAFEWSEEDELPYVVAVPAGACYALEGVRVGAVQQPKADLRFHNSPDLTNVGRRAVLHHQKLLARERRVRQRAGGRGLVQVDGHGSEAAIITSGYHVSRVREALLRLGLSERVRVLHSLLTSPFPTDSLARELDGIDRLVFVEDLGGFLEQTLSRALLDLNRTVRVSGKEVFPATGALDLQTVEQGLGQIFGVSREPIALPTPLPEVPEREGTFCPGCPDRAFFFALTEQLGPHDVLGGDIGCSSLPPHFSSWLTCMNSGTAIAAGVTLALNGRDLVVSLIGDSTLLHSGLQTIIEAVATDSDQICFVLDNHWTAMTGHQRTPATPVDAAGQPCSHLDIEQLLRACGVQRLSRADPFHLDAFRALLKRLRQERGFRVVLIQRECGLQERRRPEKPGWKQQFVLD